MNWLPGSGGKIGGETPTVGAEKVAEASDDASMYFAKMFANQPRCGLPMSMPPPAVQLKSSSMLSAPGETPEKEV